MSSCGDPPDTLNVVSVDTHGVLFAVKRCEIRGVNQPALTATRCDQAPIGERDRLTLVARGDVALKQLVDRPSAKCGIPVSDCVHLTRSIPRLGLSQARRQARAAERSSTRSAPRNRRWLVGDLWGALPVRVDARSRVRAAPRSRLSPGLLDARDGHARGPPQGCG